MEVNIIYLPSSSSSLNKILKKKVIKKTVSKYSEILFVKEYLLMSCPINPVPESEKSLLKNN